MNTKLVKRLISEATTPGGREGLGGAGGYELDEQLLIELVVKECAQYIEDKFDFCGDELFAADELRKHFGVKE